MATTASELAALLPVLVDEISRLKQLHSLAGIAELPVKDTVVREELAGLRSDFAQIKLLFGGTGATMPAGSNQAHTTGPAARKDEDADAALAFSQAMQQPAEAPPPARPRLGSVGSGMLPLPAGCDTHFFLVSTNDPMKSSL